MTETVITYERLDAALQSLGFTKHQVDGGILYWERANDAHLLIPDLAPESPVRAYHLAAARLTVTERGIAEAEEFEKALERAA